MSERNDNERERLDPIEAFGHHDDTLADGPGSARPPENAIEWLAAQRFMHGLLRHMHSADASAREQRVQAVLGQLQAPAERTPTRMAAVLAVAVVLFAAVWWLLPASVTKPTAEAAVARAAALLGENVDRRFLLTMTRPEAASPRRQESQFTLTTRPGMHFLVEGDGPFGRLRMGCDGEEIWFVPPMKGMPIMAVPLAQAQQVLAMAGDVLDLGYLDIQGLVQRLPGGCELKTLGEERGANGERLLRVEATNLPEDARRHLVRAVLLCDEDSGMVTRIECEGRSPRDQQVRSVFEYQGTVQLDAGAYVRPNKQVGRGRG